MSRRGRGSVLDDGRLVDIPKYSGDLWFQALRVDNACPCASLARLAPVNVTPVNARGVPMSRHRPAVSVPRSARLHVTPVSLSRHVTPVSVCGVLRVLGEFPTCRVAV
eukprot:6688169-Prymnesium_polylepis.1